MPRTSYRAYKALFDAYLTVAGSAAGFWNDLGGRVYSDLIYPDKLGHASLPYACLPMADEQPPLDVQARHLLDTIRVDCVIFVAGNARSTDPDRSTLRAVLNAYEDHKQLLVPGDNMRSVVTESGDLQNAEIVKKGNRSGLPDGIDWGEAWITVDLHYAQDYADLGPGAE